MRAGPDVGVFFDYNLAEKLADPLYSDKESSGGGFLSFLSTPFGGNLWTTTPTPASENSGSANGIRFDTKMDSMEGSFRPLVCLKSDVLLKKNEDGTYTIK